MARCVGRGDAAPFTPDRQPDAPVKLTHHELASLVGASRERTTAALQQLGHCDLLALRRGKIVIRDLEGLRRYSDGVRTLAAVDLRTPPE